MRLSNLADDFEITKLSDKQESVNLPIDTIKRLDNSEASNKKDISNEE